MTICQDWIVGDEDGPERVVRCNSKMIFSLERRTWYCPVCGNSVRVPKEQQSLNEYTR